MKKIILMLLCIISMQVNAQKWKTTKKGDYLKSSYIDQYIGTWEWKSGNDSFTIKFKKVKHHQKELEIDEDLLYGWFKYVKDGKVIENSLSNFGKDSLSKAVASESEQHTLVIFFTDINTKRSRMAIMELIPGEKKKAVWRIDPAYPEGITREDKGIPAGDKWIMEKIE